MSARSWKPIRRGAIYCSPACGGDCKKRQHDERVRRGKYLVSRMNKHSKGWAARIHENLGWHLTLELKLGKGNWVGPFTLKLYEDTNAWGDRTYWTLLGNAGGEPRYHVKKSNFKTPEAAVDAQIRIFRDHVKEIASAASKFEEAQKAA